MDKVEKGFTQENISGQDENYGNRVGGKSQQKGLHPRISGVPIQFSVKKGEDEGIFRSFYSLIGLQNYHRFSVCFLFQGLILINVI